MVRHRKQVPSSVNVDPQNTPSGGDGGTSTPQRKVSAEEQATTGPSPAEDSDMEAILAQLDSETAKATSDRPGAAQATSDRAGAA